MWTASGHSHVLHDFRTKKGKRDIHNFRYLTKEADMEKFILTFDSDYDNLFMTNSDLDEEVHGQRLQAAVETSCDSEPRKLHPPTGKRTKNYWWSEELTALRRVVMWIRRKTQRAMARGATDALQWSQKFRQKKER